MKANWFYILTALAEEDLHGLAIVRSVQDQTEGAVTLWPATLYGALETLARDGLIRELDDAELADDVSRQRRYYSLTPGGRAALSSEANRLIRMGAGALQRLEEAP